MSNKQDVIDKLFLHSAADQAAAANYRQMVAKREQDEKEALLKEKITKSQSSSATAYHEAAHAVIAVVVGHEVKEVSIIAKGRRQGRVRLKKAATKEPHLPNLAAMAMAGCIAQDRLCKTDFATFLGGHHDMIKFMRVADDESLQGKKTRYYPTYNTPRYWEMRHASYLRMKQWEAETRKLVDKYWAAIERVATVLMRVKVITGHDYLVGIINEVRP